MARLSLIFVLMLLLTGCTKTGGSKVVGAGPQNDPISQFLKSFTNRMPGSYVYVAGSTNAAETPEAVLARLSREGAKAYPPVSNFNIIEIRAIHPDEQRLALMSGTENVVALVSTERGRKFIHLWQDERATNIWSGTNIWWFYHVYDSK